jgi:hypothetical protein
MLASDSKFGVINLFSGGQRARKSESMIVTFGAIIVPRPIFIVFDLATIEVPFKPTESSMIIFAEADKVFNTIGENKEDEAVLLVEETKVTPLPMTIWLRGDLTR